MQKTLNPFSFSKIHIDAARNSTDDFNLFHDKNKWTNIEKNPFDGPIVLGFQLVCLIESLVRKYRSIHGENEIIRQQRLRYSNYQFWFANAIKPGEVIEVNIKNSRMVHKSNAILGNRVTIRTENGIALLGHKQESTDPLFLAESHFGDLGNLTQLPDRSYLSDHGIFLKRKYMNTGNAKNFLSGSLVEQSDYFDELEGRVTFPEIFPVSLISCALLEKALVENHNFEQCPMVYTSHQISVDRTHINNMKSNDVLHILVKKPEIMVTQKGLGKSNLTQQVYECFGLEKDNEIVFRAIISLAALQDILENGKRNSRNKGSERINNLSETSQQNAAADFVKTAQAEAVSCCCALNTNKIPAQSGKFLSDNRLSLFPLHVLSLFDCKNFQLTPILLHNCGTKTSGAFLNGQRLVCGTYGCVK